MAYTDQLAHPSWQKRRLQIFERDKWPCQASDCRSTTKFLNVHHIEYFDNKKAWEYPDELLITLCQDCHEKENNRGSLEKILSNTLKSKGFLVCDLVALSVRLERDEVFRDFLFHSLRQYQEK